MRSTLLDYVLTSVESRYGTVEPYSSALVLITIPLGVLKARPPKFTPPLPPRRIETIEAMGMGILNKVVLIYKDVWWPNDHSSFTFLPDPSNPTELRGPKASLSSNPRAGYVTNFSYCAGVPALTWIFSGDVGDTLEESTDEEISKWASKMVIKYLGPKAVRPPTPPVDVWITRWRNDPYSQGSYCFWPAKNLSIDSGNPAQRFSERGGSPLDCKEMARPLWGRWFFAGEHTEPDHFASVHGAYLSGVREGIRIEDALASLSASR